MKRNKFWWGSRLRDKRTMEAFEKCWRKMDLMEGSLNFIADKVEAAVALALASHPNGVRVVPVEIPAWVVKDIRKVTEKHWMDF